MPSIKHPFDPESLYQVDEEGNIRVSNGNQWGVFTREGRHLSGDIRQRTLNFVYGSAIILGKKTSYDQRPSPRNERYRQSALVVAGGRQLVFGNKTSGH